MPGNVDRSVNEYTIPNDTDSAFNEMSNTGENESETVNQVPSTIPYSSDLSSFGLIKKGLRIGNLNVCHLLPKIDEIRLLLNEHRSVNILGLCETFLNDHIDNNELSIDSFIFERRDRDDGRSGGGILMYISNQLSYKRRRDLEEGSIESIWIELFVPGSKSILLCSAYRPPSSPTSWVDGLANEVRKASLCDDTEVILAGDFNLDYVTRPPQFWINAIEEFHMSQIITTPTRVTVKSATLLDHVYTNKPENICEINVPTIALSDHYPVCFTYRCHKSIKKCKHIEIQYRDFKHVDENVFMSDMLESNFDALEQIYDPDEVVTAFYSLFFGVVNKHAKTKNKRVKCQLNPSWMTPEIKEARHARDYYHKKKDPINYKYWRNKVTALINAAKEKYYKSAIDENKNSKDIWKYIKELRPKADHSSPTMLTVNDQTATNNTDIVNMFNDYFVNLSNALLSDNADYRETLRTLKQFTQSKLNSGTEFCIQPIDETAVFTMLQKLNINKSSGVDCLGPRLLKLAAPVISKSVAHMINQSITREFFPNELKIAKVIPIYKKGDRSDPGNYRPISILPTLSKIYERHVASQIHNYCLRLSCYM